MALIWPAFLERLNRYPKGTHNIRPPCSTERLRQIESEFGACPIALREMLSHFDGAELFIDFVPLLTVFSISPTVPVPEREWAPNWYIDKFTPKWRAAGKRDGDWAIAMTNYGGLTIFDSANICSEWDTAESRWLSRGVAIDDWIENVISEGDLYLAEAK